jgi:hypothetical protein
LPSFKRGRQVMVMLQAYADESWTHKGPRMFALGGFVAPTEIWARFSDEWQRVLDMKPRIDYFKWDEAVHLKGEFVHWREWRRNERVRLLQNVINAFRPGYCFVAAQMNDFEEVFGGTYVKSHLYVCLMTILCREMYRALGSVLRYPADESIDFYFDEQLAEKSEMIGSWATARRYMEIEYRDSVFRKLFIEGNLPAFRNDKLVLPIQAADMLVGIIGRKLSDRVGRGQSFLPTRKFDSPIWGNAKGILNGRGAFYTKEAMLKDRKRLEMLGKRLGKNWT